MKIAVIGAAGSVGAPAVFYLAARGLADDILMIGGSRQNVLKQHAMDLSTAFSYKDIRITAGDYSDLPGSDIVINTAGAAQGLIKDRMEMLPKNLSIISHIAGQIKTHCPNAIVITATNPVDPLNYATFKMTGFHRRQLIGYSINDSFRFREIIAANCKVPVSQVEGTVIGEHGSTQVPLFSTVKINAGPVRVSDDIKRSVYETIPTILAQYEAFQAGRTAGWTCAVGLEQMVRAIVTDKETVLPCSAILDGEYGVEDLSMSVPVKLTRQGITGIVECQLADDERTMLHRSIETLQKANTIVNQFLQTT